jgi:hypothetical protein
MISDVIGSDAAGGGSRGVRVEVEGERKGRTGVDGRGAAAGAERRAESALSCGSERSTTRSWSWNWRRAMIRDEVRWLMPWKASSAIWGDRERFSTWTG